MVGLGCAQGVVNNPGSHRLGATKLGLLIGCSRCVSLVSWVLLSENEIEKGHRQEARRT